MAVFSFSVCQALVVRFILILHVFLCTWRVVADLKDPMYWLLICGLCPLLCESCYTIVRRNGVEFSRFTPCFFFYLGAVLPGIWLLELDKTDLYIAGKQPQGTHTDNITEEQALLVISLSPKTWIIIIEEMLPYVMFLGRWILPRGRVRREELAELLFAFIEIAADIMEFFSLFDEDVIRSDKTLAYCVLAIWSLAVLQFTMTVTVIYQPKKEKNYINMGAGSDKETASVRIQHECFAIFLTIIMQDLPFAAMRLYTIVKFNYINYSLIFFTSKNLIIITLLLYKVAALCKPRYCPDAEDRKGDVEQFSKESVIERSESVESEKKCSFDTLDQVGTDVENLCFVQEVLCKRHNLNMGSESGMRQRCCKCDETINDDGVMPRSICGGQLNSLATQTTESLGREMGQKAKLSPGLHQCPSVCAENGPVLVDSSEMESVLSVPDMSSSVVALEVGDGRCSDQSGQADIVKTTCEGKMAVHNNKSDIAKKLKEIEHDVSVLKALSPRGSVTYLLMSVISIQEQ